MALPLSGHYSYDDEGQPARRVDLVRDGVLQNFLMSRLPASQLLDLATVMAAPRPVACPPAVRAI